MEGQMNIFDFIADPESRRIGSYVRSHGRAIPHIMMHGYIGKEVVIDVSTISHPWFQVGILEDYIPHEGSYRAIVYTGKKQRSLIGIPKQQIYETEQDTQKWSQTAVN